MEIMQDLRFSWCYC